MRVRWRKDRFEPGHAPAGERAVQCARRLEDRIAFRHRFQPIPPGAACRCRARCRSPGHEAHCRRKEAGVHQEWGERVFGSGRTVDLRHQQSAAAVFSARDRGELQRQWTADRRSRGLILGKVDEELTAAARNVGGKRPVDDDHLCADSARGAAPCRSALDPAATSASCRRVGRIGRGEHDHFRLPRAVRAATAAARARPAARTASHRRRRRSSRAGSVRHPPAP